MNPKVLQFTALGAQFVAFMLGFIILFAGKNGHLEDIYFLSLNTSKLGHDALADVDLFAFNSSSLLHGLLPTKMSYAIPNSKRETYTTVTRKSQLGNEFTIKRRQAPPDPPPSSISMTAEALVDIIMGKLGVDPGGNVPQTVKKAVRTVVTDVQRGVQICSANTQAQIVSDVSLIVADTLNKLADSYRASATAGVEAPKSPAMKRHASAQSVNQELQSLERLQDFYMSSEEADYVSHLLAQEVQGNAVVSEALLDGMTKMIKNFNRTSDIPIGVRKSVIAQSSTNFASESPRDDGLKVLAGVVRATAPIISQGFKEQLIQTMNAGVDHVKSKVPVYDWYNFYELHMCWGRYAYAKDGKVTRHTVGCGTTASWKDVNIAPVISRILDSVGFSTKLPDKIGIGKGLEQTFSGLRSFTQLIYVINILNIIGLVGAFVGTLIGVCGSATGFIKGPWIRKTCLLNVILCANAASLVYSNAIVMTLSLGGMGYMLPGSMNSAAVGVELGGTFIGLLWFHTLLTVTGTSCWFALWKAVAMKEEFRRGIKRGKEKAAAENAVDNSAMADKNPPMTVVLDQGSHPF